MDTAFLAAYSEAHKIPLADCQDEIVKILYRVARPLGRQFRFGNHSEEDIVQEAVLIGLEIIAKGKYNPTRKLDAFLQVSLKNRLINFKRNNYIRPNPRCSCCLPGTETPCENYKALLRLNEMKIKVTHAIPIDKVQVKASPHVFLDEELDDLPESLRRDACVLLNGGGVDPDREQLLLDYLRGKTGRRAA